MTRRRRTHLSNQDARRGSTRTVIRFDFDGQVDLDDFAILKGQFGSRIPAAPGAASPAHDRSLAGIGVAFARGAGDWWRPNDDRDATLEPLSRLADARNIPPTASPRVAR